MSGERLVDVSVLEVHLDVQVLAMLTPCNFTHEIAILFLKKG